MADALAALQSKLQHRFQDPKLLARALTHRSFSAEHNERLEFLGDAVLNLAVAALLYEQLASLPEGDLTKVRASLVRQEPLHQIALGLGLPALLRVGEGEARTNGRNRPSILADALEAVVGAVYLDGGYPAAEQDEPAAVPGGRHPGRGPQADLRRGMRSGRAGHGRARHRRVAPGRRTGGRSGYADGAESQMEMTSDSTPAAPAGQRCGLVAIVGKPNVGKSTLLNALVGQKISITSSKAQTTRHRITGVRTEGQAQFVFVDTPGFQTKHGSALNRSLNRAVTGAIGDVDVVLFVVEAGNFTLGDAKVLSLLKPDIPAILVANKLDTLHRRGDLAPWLRDMQERHPFAEFMPISAKNAKDVERVLQVCEKTNSPTGASASWPARWSAKSCSA
ncbi:MAG: era [Ramlibacter sp.]|nr:era [Ramlibacter sp.]